jgi:hypothetical protein
VSTHSAQRTPIKTPKNGHNGDPALNGRIEVGPLTRRAEKATAVSGGSVLLAEREVYLDGERIGTVLQFQRRGFRLDSGGQRRVGPGLPTYWEFVDRNGRDYRDYGNRALAHCLFESITVEQGGSI